MAPGPTVSFLGGAGTVTGSKYLVEIDDARVLIDCGLFQGPKPLRRRNWDKPPFDPDYVDAVLLTHAHLDHSGYLPVLAKSGFKGPVYCTSGTKALAKVLLPDSGFLQEEDARYANHKGFSRHRPAAPLYTQADAEASLALLNVVEFEAPVDVATGIRATFRPAGHILGASSIRLEIAGRSITFSGDIGRQHDPVMKPPLAPAPTDFLVVESTYGNRVHAQESPIESLREIASSTLERNGVLLIPSFSVGRAQAILHLLAELKRTSRIPATPIYLNSPMSIDATSIYCQHMGEHRLDRKLCTEMCTAAQFVRSAEESRALNEKKGPMIVVSASGMATGGRVVHHLKAWLGDRRNTVLFAGFQAPGTRGASLVGGAGKVRMHGQEYAVLAQIEEISGLSAHADQNELIQWIEPVVRSGTRNVFVTHGEPEASQALAHRISSEYGLDVDIPAYNAKRVLN